MLKSVTYRNFNASYIHVLLKRCLLILENCLLTVLFENRMRCNGGFVHRKITLLEEQAGRFS